MKKVAGEGRSRRCHGDAMKPLTSWLAAVEAAEKALELRVWGVGLRVGGGACRRRSRDRVWNGGPATSPELGRTEGLEGGPRAVED
jgi:hypothetical protein